MFNEICINEEMQPPTKKKIYIYIFWQHFFINAYFVEHNRHLLSTYFFVDPFIMAC